MTRLADPLILECLKCKAPLRQKRLASVNGFGAPYWSDGYAHIAMVPEAGWLGSCPHCHTVFWVADARRLGWLPKKPVSLRWGWFRRLLERWTGYREVMDREESAWSAVPEAWHNAVELEQLTPAALFHCLQHGLASTPEREIYLRTRLWWIGNHQQRDMNTSNPMSVQERTDNMDALLRLIRSTPSTRSDAITEGELLRQLGRFDEAVTVLAPVENDSDMATRIVELARQGELEVCIIRELW